MICPPTPSQLLIEASLSLEGWIERRSEQVRERLEACRSAMRECRGLEWREPGGGFFTLARISSGEDSSSAALRLLEEYSIATIPGCAFGETAEGHLRVSFGCLSDEDLRPAMETLSRVDLL